MKTTKNMKKNNKIFLLKNYHLNKYNFHYSIS